MSGTLVRRSAQFLFGLLLAGLLLVTGAAPSQADDPAPVVAGTWTLTIKVPHPNAEKGIFTQPGTRSWYFGEGCAVGTACSMSRTTGEKKTIDQKLTSSGGAFTIKLHTDLDCYDNETGVLDTPHGADYDMVGRIRPTAFQVRDGVRYATALTGTYREVVVVNARGRATNCKSDAGRFVERQVANITGVPVALATPPDKTSPSGLALDPDSTAGSGTLDELTLATTDRQQESVDAVAAGRRSSVPGALSVPSEAVKNVADRIGKDLLLVALLGLLMVFPAQLFNSTYEENNERIDRTLAKVWRRRGASATGPASSPPRGRRLAVFLGCVLVGTVLGGLLDPKFGANTASYALLVGVFAAVILAVLLAAVAGRMFRSATHRGHEWYLRAIPTALTIAVVCVVVSRLSHFQPGYLYGVLGGAVFAGALERRSEGRAEVFVFGGGLLLAALAWLAFEPVSALANKTDPSFGVLALDSFLGSLFIGGIEGLLFGMIPLRFLPGHRIAGWSWVVWGVLTALVLFVFVHVLLIPEAGYLGRSTVASVNLTLVLFGVFAVASVLFWLWFRLRPSPEAVEDEEPHPTVEGEAPVVDDDDETVAGEAPAPPGIPADPESEPVLAGATGEPTQETRP